MSGAHADAFAWGEVIAIICTAFIFMLAAIVVGFVLVERRGRPRR